MECFKFNKLSRSKQKGSALLEAIIALSAVVMAMAGIAIVVTSSVSNAAFIQNQNQANKYAQEGMEYMRSMRDESYNNFLSTFPLSQIGSVTRCMGAEDSENSGQFLLGVGSGENCPQEYRLDEGKFIREVTVSSSVANRCGNIDLDNTRLVSVKVSWQSSKCDVENDSFCHSSQVDSCFTRPPIAEL